MVGPAFARHARTDSPRERGGETIFSLRGPPAGRHGDGVGEPCGAGGGDAWEFAPQVKRRLWSEQAVRRL